MVESSWANLTVLIWDGNPLNKSELVCFGMIPNLVALSICGCNGVREHHVQSFKETYPNVTYVNWIERYISSDDSGTESLDVSNSDDDSLDESTIKQDIWSIALLLKRNKNETK